MSAALRAELRLGETQNNLGSALETGTKRLGEAVEAYRAALQKQTRERVLLDWAMTQNNLGSALRGLGERESSTKRLEEAAASFSNVLQVDPDDERAYNKLNILYHDKLFAFAEAFDLNQAWLERHPDDLGAQANFAEAAFTVGRFAEAEQRLAALVDHPKLKPGPWLRFARLRFAASSPSTGRTHCGQSLTRWVICLRAIAMNLRPTGPGPSPVAGTSSANTPS